MNATLQMNSSRPGKIRRIRGPVVDVEFTGGLPAINNEIRIGNDQPVVGEVISHLDPTTVQCIANTRIRWARHATEL